MGDNNTEANNIEEEKTKQNSTIPGIPQTNDMKITVVAQETPESSVTITSTEDSELQEIDISGKKTTDVEKETPVQKGRTFFASVLALFTTA